MTPVSRKKLPKTTELLLNDALVDTFSNLNKNEVIQVISTLLTDTEVEMLRKRVGMLFLLNENLVDKHIARILATTRQTVVRIKLQLLNISDEDKNFVINKLNKWKRVKQLKNLAKDIGTLPISRSEFRKKISPF